MRSEHDRLADIRSAIAAIDAHVERADELEGGRADPLLDDALLYQLAVIGEAVKNLPSRTRSSAPDVPWQDIAGLRDIITHEYFRIDAQRIFDIVEQDVPKLRLAVDRLLAGG